MTTSPLLIAHDSLTAKRVESNLHMAKLDSFLVNKSHSTSVLVGLVLCLVGCDGDVQIKIAPVEGKVTLDGKPLTQGHIIFTPQVGRSAKGQIQQDGSFRLGTYGNRDGATVGMHQVSILAIEDNGESTFESTVEPNWLIPQRYGSAATSGLEFEVRAGANNEPTFDLSSE